jgi:hypothetical protein
MADSNSTASTILRRMQYSPVVTWFSLRTLLTLALLNNWHTQQIDFVQAYTQAPIEFDLYMELPKGIETKDGNRKKRMCSSY